MAKLKCPFPIKHLEERLGTERTWLKMFNTWLIRGKNTSDNNLILSAEENIKNCEHRITELEDAITFISKQKKKNNLFYFIRSVPLSN